jgi:protein-tyrosine phosphatase
MIQRVDDNLYLSDLESVYNSQELIQLGISRIVSCLPVEELPVSYWICLYQKIPDMKILRVPIMDREDVNLFEIPKKHLTVESCKENLMLDQITRESPLVEQTYRTICHWIRSGRKVLVHCYAGISRSVSICVYYLIKRNNVSYEQAITSIKKIRPIADPNPSFARQLMAFSSNR